MISAGLTHWLLLAAASSSGGRNSQFLFITRLKVGAKEGNVLILNSSVSPGPGAALARRGGHQEHPRGQGSPHLSPAAQSARTECPRRWEHPRDPVHGGDTQGGQGMAQCGHSHAEGT